jgi:hypothetical protein
MNQSDVLFPEAALVRNYTNIVLVIFEINDVSGVALLGSRMDDRGSRVGFPAEAGNISLHHRVHNGSGAHIASYPMGTRGSFSGGKLAET